MTKKLRLAIGVFLLVCINISAQQVNIAKAYYVKAKEAYANENYQETISYLDKVRNELGASNPDITYLDIVAHYKLDKADPRIDGLANEFINTADSSDSRMQEISLILVEHREIRAEAQKKEADAYTKAVTYRSLEALRSYKQQYPNSAKISEIDSILVEKENKDYQLSKSQNTINAYDKFLLNYPNSQYALDVQSSRAVLFDKKKYDEAKAQGNISGYDAYLREFPEGSYVAQAKSALEVLLFDEANKNFNSGKLDEAKVLYTRYTKEYPNGSNISEVNESISEVDHKLARLDRINSRTSAKYIMGTYSSYPLYGIEFGRLSLFKLSTYFNFSVNENIGKMQFEFEDEDDTPAVLPEDLLQSSLSVSFGLTYKIAYPVWIYGGATMVYSEFYDEEEGVSYKFEDINPYQFAPELGLKIMLGKVAVLKGGATYLNDQVYYNVGIGFQTSRGRHF